MPMNYVTHLETLAARADLFIIVYEAMITHDSDSNGIQSSKKKQVGKQTDTKTYRQTDRQANTETNKLPNIP